MRGLPESQSHHPTGFGMASMHLPAGQHLGQASRYVITRPLAVGGFGVVYEAQDPKGRPVAIKTIAVAKAKGASIARLQREASSYAACVIRTSSAASTTATTPHLVFIFW